MCIYIGICFTSVVTAKEQTTKDTRAWVSVLNVLKYKNVTMTSEDKP